ncbi:unnamed protein product [Boreogadus saida]
MLPGNPVNRVFDNILARVKQKPASYTLKGLHSTKFDLLDTRAHPARQRLPFMQWEKEETLRRNISFRSREGGEGV